MATVRSTQIPSLVGFPPQAMLSTVLNSFQLVQAFRFARTQNPAAAAGLTLTKIATTSVQDYLANYGTSVLQKAEPQPEIGLATPERTPVILHHPPDSCSAPVQHQSATG